MNKQTIDIFSLLKDTTRDQKIIAKSHSIKLVGKTNKKIYADKIRISQVINNLITNAIKYSPGKKQIIISIANKEGGVIVAVKDFGIGLSAEEQGKIFERFYRANAAKTPGHGLGLYISWQIITMHNGKISLKSTPGKGSTFYVDLPEAA